MKDLDAEVLSLSLSSLLLVLSRFERHGVVMCFVPSGVIVVRVSVIFFVVSLIYMYSV